MWACRNDDRRSARQHLMASGWTILLAGVLALWVLSLLFTVTRFGEHVTVTFEQGFLGLYWGDDADLRNSHVDNHFSPPWSPETGVGRDFPVEMTWAFYGPHLRLADWPDALSYGTFWTCELGFWMPSLVRGPYSSLILPIWVLVIVAAIGISFSMLRRLRRARPGCCNSCGYNLTGNVSGRCPECGTAISGDGA